MSVIFGKGKPLPTTDVSLGDVYVDGSDRNKQYKCTFAYKGPDEEGFKCEWSELDVDDYVSYVHHEEEVTKPEPVVEKPVIKEEVKTTTDKPVEHRKNYTQYSKRS